MKTTLTILFILSFGQLLAQDSVFGWYKVIETTNDTVWSKGQNILIERGTDANAVEILGFSNHGGRAHGYVNGTKLIIPKQEAPIVPYGGGGNLQWIINIKADGSITDSGVILNFSFQKDGEAEHLGKLKAVKRAKEVGSYVQSDTTIRGIVYRWKYYDYHKRLMEVGQSFEDQIKRGRWMYYDFEGVLQKEVVYRNDTLHGWALEYDDSGSELTMEEGLYLNGTRVGKWKRRGKIAGQNWAMKDITLYNIEGRVVMEAIPGSKEKPDSEIYYSEDERPVWYRYFDEKGKLLHEGPTEIVIIDGMLLEGR